MKEMFKNIKERFEGISDPNDEKMPLKKRNYALLLIGFSLILLGFVLMAGGKSASPDEFNYDMFSVRRITIAPILVVAGFVFEIFGILKK